MNLQNSHNPKLSKVSIKNVNFGKGVQVIEPVNLYDCSISDECFVGPFVEIQKGCNIGYRTKIQSHTFICELVNIGADCFIGHGVMFINDLFSDGGPAKGDKSKWLETNISDNVSIGSNATILPVDICSHVVIGAGSVVVKNIDKPGVYAGNPATLIKDYNN